MTEPIRYPVTPALPYNTPIFVEWNGYHLKAIKSRNPKTGDDLWLEVRSDGERRPLPPQGQRTLWGDEPYCWWPIGEWKGVLPQPLSIVVEPQLYTSRISFELVNDAEASDLAREMEHDREAARANGGKAPTEKRRDPITMQWWRDITRIRYEPRGQVSLTNLEGRIMRAVATSGLGQGLTLRSKATGDVLAELADLGSPSYDGPISDWAPRLQALPKDTTDFLEAMSWFTALNPPETWHPNREYWDINNAQIVIGYRALPMPWSFSEIGEKKLTGKKNKPGVSGERARQIYIAALDRALKLANGPIVDNPLIVAVRERNRLARAG